MMDVDRCAAALVSRCAFLVAYHHDPARRRAGRAGMAHELEWLAADARRWGVPGEVITSGVRAELDRLHDRETARELFAVFVVEFRRAAGPPPEDLPADQPGPRAGRGRRARRGAAAQ